MLNSEAAQPPPTSNIHGHPHSGPIGRGGHIESIQVQQCKDALMMIRMQCVQLIMTLLRMRSAHLGRPPACLRREAIYLRRRSSGARKRYSGAVEPLTTSSDSANHQEAQITLSVLVSLSKALYPHCRLA